MLKQRGHSVKRRLPPWFWAVHAAMALLGCAALVLFLVHPGGFEEQVGWFLALMPGAILGLPFADRVYRIAPGAAITAYRFIVRRP